MLNDQADPSLGALATADNLSADAGPAALKSSALDGPPLATDHVLGGACESRASRGRATLGYVA